MMSMANTSDEALWASLDYILGSTPDYDDADVAAVGCPRQLGRGDTPRVTAAAASAAPAAVEQQASASPPCGAKGHAHLSPGGSARVIVGAPGASTTRRGTMARPRARRR